MKIYYIKLVTNYFLLVFIITISFSHAIESEICNALSDKNTISIIKSESIHEKDKPSSPDDGTIMKELGFLQSPIFKELSKPQQFKTTLKALKNSFHKDFQNSSRIEESLYWLEYIIYSISPRSVNLPYEKLKNFDLLKPHLEESQKKILKYTKPILPFKNDVDTLTCNREFGLCAGYSQFSRLFNILVLDNNNIDSEESKKSNLTLSQKLIYEAENVKTAILRYKPYKLKYFPTKDSFVENINNSVLKMPLKVLIDTALILWFRNFLSLEGILQLVDYNLYGTKIQMNKSQIENLFRLINEHSKYYPIQTFVTFFDPKKNRLHKDIHVVLATNHQHGTPTNPEIDVINIRDDKFYGDRSITTFENRIYFSPSFSNGKFKRNIFYISPHIFNDELLIQLIEKSIVDNSDLGADQSLVKIHDIILSYINNPKNNNQNAIDMRTFLHKQNQIIGSENFDRQYLKEFVDVVDKIGVVPSQESVMISALMSLNNYIEKFGSLDK